MKQFLLRVISSIAIGFFAFYSVVNAQIEPVKTEKRNPVKEAKKAFVLLELFTSEGCPTCPPADANLAFLEKEQPFADTEIVTLALHIDYLNSVVWKDLYSSPIFSRRQQLYSQALKTGATFTPQMIVDGHTGFPGSNLAKAQKAILEAAKSLKATIEITPTNEKLKIKITDVPAHQNAMIFLAVTEDNLLSNRKSSAANKKSELISAVRELKSLGILTPEQSSLELETVLQIQPEWKKEDLKFVVFVQENASRRVLGVSRSRIPVN
jgi:hypothetical protein